MIDPINIIFIMLFLLVAVLAYSIYRTRLADVTKMIALPIAIVLAAYGGWHYEKSLGAPIEEFPTEFTYIHHISDGKLTRLWAHTEHGHRLFVFVYDQKNEEQLQEAQEKTEQGVPVKGEFKPDEEGIAIPQFFESPESEIPVNPNLVKDY